MAIFVRHEACSVCNSSDAKAVYDDESWHCFSCGATSPSEEYKEELAEKSTIRTKPRQKKEARLAKSQKEPISNDEAAEIVQMSGFSARGFRGIRDDTYEKFGVRHSVDPETGQVTKQFCPVTKAGARSGYKVRTVPKDFYSVGNVGRDCDLFMQRNFPKPAKYLLITEGEIDALSAYQMLRDYYVKKDMDYEVAVVSGTTGAKSAQQIAMQYKFCDQFQNIVVCYDNDDAGQESVQEVVDSLPKGKVKIMQMKLKDANKYIEQGRESEFVRDFFSAEPYVPVGVVGSGALYEKMINQAVMPKIEFPPFMKKANAMLGGGCALGHTYNIAADTGAGKTTYINEIVYYWIFNCPYKVGVVTMELDSGQYAEVLLSRHLQKKIALMSNDEERETYLKSSLVKDRAHELFFTDDDLHRFYLLDNRDGNVAEIQAAIEELVISCGCKVIIIDPLQDVLDGLGNDDQALFMKWVKGMQKSHGIAIFLINHLRKSANGGAEAGKGEDYSEQDIIGSSTIIKSASVNILLGRNKYAEDSIVRNTTKVRISKNRRTGLTGPAGEIYYEAETHTLHDFDDYFKSSEAVPIE